jgi:hypothetical protein
MAHVRADSVPSHLSDVTRLIVRCRSRVEPEWASFWKQPSSHRITHVTLDLDPPKIEMASVAVEFLRMVPNLERVSVLTAKGFIVCDTPTFGDVVKVLSRNCASRNEVAIEVLDTVVSRFDRSQLSTQITELTLKSETTCDTEFSRSEPNITTDILRDILDKFPNLTTLTMWTCGDLGRFTFPSNIRKLTLMLNVAPALRSFTITVNAPEIDTLELCGNAAVDHQQDVICAGDLSSLKSLTLRNINVTEWNLAIMVTARRLKYIEIDSERLSKTVVSSLFRYVQCGIRWHWCTIKPGV